MAAAAGIWGLWIDESHDLRWVPVHEVAGLTEEESVLRMVRKMTRLR